MCEKSRQERSRLRQNSARTISPARPKSRDWRSSRRAGFRFALRCTCDSGDGCAQLSQCGKKFAVANQLAFHGSGFGQPACWFRPLIAVRVSGDRCKLERWRRTPRSGGGVPVFGRTIRRLVQHAELPVLNAPPRLVAQVQRLVALVVGRPVLPLH